MTSHSEESRHHYSFLLETFAYFFSGPTSRRVPPQKRCVCSFVCSEQKGPLGLARTLCSNAEWIRSKRLSHQVFHFEDSDVLSFAKNELGWACPAHTGQRRQTSGSCPPGNRALQGSFSAVSKRNFASKYAFESSRRDLHNALLCTALKSHLF